MKQVTPTIAGDLEAVNRLILEQLHSDVPLVENIGHYIVESGGKRLRPQLVLLAAGSVGARGHGHIHLAAIIEFIHTATLLHDDVVDVSSLRRGRPTANARWGNAPSVLVGDFVYSRAFQMLVALGEPRILALLADATNRIAEGEVLQLVRAGQPETTEAQYLEVIERKTAVLFEAATRGGAILGQASPAQEEALSRYGLALGMAFQLVDDVLDYTGDAAVMGKNVGDDLAEGKATLPLIHTLRAGSPAQQALVRTALQERSTGQIADILEAVLASGAIDYTRDMAARASATAREALGALPNTPCRAAMLRLTDIALQRSS